MQKIGYWTRKFIAEFLTKPGLCMAQVITYRKLRPHAQ